MPAGAVACASSAASTTRRSPEPGTSSRNDYWPRWFRRRPEQTCLQTWHGAPLKRQGYDLAAKPRAFREYRRVLSQRHENWHYVVSPGPFATPILRSAFPVDEVIETGLPRADLLFRPYRDRLADDVRRRLGLGDERVVLYAPTYRDQLAHRGGYRLGRLLELAALRSALGEDHAVLFRKHGRVVGALPDAADEWIRDVSEYPDAADLLLVADVLVTDYSSLSFDFAVTGRPIVFFTPDLDAYREVSAASASTSRRTRLGRSSARLTRSSKLCGSRTRSAPTIESGTRRSWRRTALSTTARPRAAWWTTSSAGDLAFTRKMVRSPLVAQASSSATSSLSETPRNRV